MDSVSSKLNMARIKFGKEGWDDEKTGLNRSQLNNWIHENCSRCQEKCPLSSSFIVDQEQPISDKNTITSKHEDTNGSVVLKSKYKKKKI